MSELLTKYWSRSIGKFVNSNTGVELNFKQHNSIFQGSVRDWYHTLRYTIASLVNELDNRIAWEDVKIYVHPDTEILVSFISDYQMIHNGKDNLVGKVDCAFYVYRDTNIKSNLIQVRVENKRGLVHILDYVQ